MNYKVIVAYDGTDYQGWQMQGERPTIQLALTRVLTTLEGAHVVVHGAGRTDSGVHAEGQVASFRLQKEWSGAALRKAMNGNLPPDIRVLQAEQVDDEFHARFSAKGKTYRYQIFNAEVMNPLLARYALHYHYVIDFDKLWQDGAALIGTHDFTVFTVADCETNTNVRTITGFHIERQAELLQLSFTGEGFLRYQVRTMVEALLQMNRGKLAMTMPELIEGQQRALIHGTAPAKGLTLMRVEY
ncbi:MAG TPA: tRNA pseudouridine(38-40) synthase TruA [Blastocatellia bacterium]|nr:tRNA pseudouridine(38-40) synthase TruA [Blastocatellia bacterium]